MQKKEILFLWDGENWNPNGDMLKDNAPRCDDETSIAEHSRSNGRTYKKNY